MSEEILINVSPRETRVAIVENGVLQEILIERASCKGLVGNIYMGTVARVLPGMQAAFVDMGHDRAAFLHADDMGRLEVEDMEAPDPNHSRNNGEAADGAESSNDKNQFYNHIEELLQPSQQLAVQVIKDPLGTKGARLTTRISLPSRYLVYMPDVEHIGISSRIEDEEEKQRLRDLINNTKTNQGGYIVRTAAEGTSAEQIAADKEYLDKLWGSIKTRLNKSRSGDIIHEDLPLYLRALRDCVSPDTERVRVDSLAAFEKCKSFSDNFVSNLNGKIEYYSSERPIFDLYSVEDEIQKALHRKVQLKSGGHLIFDQTEAMTTIDVNTGAFVGKRNLEETIFKTNLEAASSIARQLRLRNLGGIIIIDFIDMTDEDHKRQVLRALEKALSSDHSKNNITEVSQLGLVEMTRKRTRESLEHVLCETCPVCLGRATIKTAETVCNEIFRELLRAERAYQVKSYLVLASQEVVDRMLDEDSTSVAQLVDEIGKPIKFQVENLYTQEQFDVVLM